MKMLCQLLLIIPLMIFTVAANSSSVETYTFESPEYENRYHQLNKILRCPKCQNQNLADSNSLISQDLRREVKRLLEEGRTDEQIMEYMVMRYGSFVLYKPALDKVTYALWYGPIAFAVFGVLMLILVIMRQRKKRSANKKDTLITQRRKLNTEEQAKIDKLLND